MIVWVITHRTVCVEKNTVQNDTTYVNHHSLDVMKMGMGNIQKIKSSDPALRNEIFGELYALETFRMQMMMKYIFSYDFRMQNLQCLGISINFF